MTVIGYITNIGLCMQLGHVNSNLFSITLKVLWRVLNSDQVDSWLHIGQWTTYRQADSINLANTLGLPE